MFSSNPTESVFLITGTYIITDRIISSTSSVFFISNEQKNCQLCIKLWRPLVNNSWKQPEPLLTLAEYLVDGLSFSRRWAPNVYLGVASIQLLNDEGIHDENVNDENAIFVNLETWLLNPQNSDLCDGKEYALVMEHLDHDLCLNYQLTHQLDNKVGMIFLAQKICHVHRSFSMEAEEHHLEESRVIGGLDALAWKLAVNQRLFQHALDMLGVSQIEQSRYNGINMLMTQAYSMCEKLFVKRSEEKKIMRCHGDLKVANLWLRPDPDNPHYLFSRNTQLLTLDCIDFEPKLCHIDTLSDVAMLVVDMQVHFHEQEVREQKSKRLIKYFLDAYFGCAQEQLSTIEPLLAYYLTEKAMVGTFMNAIYDEEPERAKSYLSIAFSHARKLYALGKVQSQIDSIPVFEAIQDG